MKPVSEKHTGAQHSEELLDCIPFNCVHNDCPAYEKYYCYAHLYEKNDQLEISFHCDRDKPMCEHMWKLGKALTDYAIKKQKGLLSDQETMGWFCPFCTNLMLRSTYKCPNCGYIPSYYQGKSPK